MLVSKLANGEGFGALKMNGFGFYSFGSSFFFGSSIFLGSSFLGSDGGASTLLGSSFFFGSSFLTAASGKALTGYYFLTGSFLTSVGPPFQGCLTLVIHGDLFILLIYSRMLSDASFSMPLTELIAYVLKKVSSLRDRRVGGKGTVK